MCAARYICGIMALCAALRLSCALLRSLDMCRRSAAPAVPVAGRRVPVGYNVPAYTRCLTPSAPSKTKSTQTGKRLQKVSCPVRNCPNQTKFRLPKSRRKRKKSNVPESLIMAVRHCTSKIAPENKKRGSVRKAHQTSLQRHGKKISEKGLTYPA